MFTSFLSTSSSPTSSEVAALASMAGAFGVRVEVMGEGFYASATAEASYVPTWVEFCAYVVGLVAAEQARECPPCVPAFDDLDAQDAREFAAYLAEREAA
jgi:hypothetical protein